ncbi:hypothetical protein KVV02_004741 [Mortierella alpina]|uniref:PWI domain-containing protein n=1 Tax=Mortierella alpina TaxID=64518 RepID=A0A9P8A6V5_MORAP|nr:hypothetical protein KVV02_004741 [Mortierella alpina]
MGDAGFFKGTSADQDTRFSDKHKKLLRSMHFPPEFSQKIDMKKVNLKVIKGWMAQRVSQLLGIEDEVVVEYAFGMLEESSPDPKTMQINLQGFLDKNSQPFVLELWKLLISAQTSLGGIPQQFLDQTKEELLQAKRAKEAELAKIREQEAKERAIAEEVRQKAQAIRNATRPSASNLQMEDLPYKSGHERIVIVTTGIAMEILTERERDMAAQGAGMDMTAESMSQEDMMPIAGGMIDAGNTAGTRIDATTANLIVIAAAPAIVAAAAVEAVVVVTGTTVETGTVVAIGNDLSATKRRRVRSTSRSRSRSRSASGNRAIKIESTGTRSRTPPPSSPSRTPSAAAAIEGRERSASSSRAIKPEDDTEDKTGKTGTTKSTSAAAVDTVALENELRERLLRERVLQSVKSKQSSQESPSEK